MFVSLCMVRHGFLICFFLLSFFRGLTMQNYGFRCDRRVDTISIVRTRLGIRYVSSPPPAISWTNDRVGIAYSGNRARGGDLCCRLWYTIYYTYSILSVMQVLLPHLYAGAMRGGVSPVSRRPDGDTSIQQPCRIRENSTHTTLLTVSIPKATTPGLHSMYISLPA